MASIYGGALLTVAFLDRTGFHASARASRGIFVPHLQDAARPRFDPQNPESIYRWLEDSGNFPSRPESDLDKRGWTFQERLLSRRVLNVTKGGLFWDCLRLNACDWRPLGFRGDPSPKFRDSDERKVKAFLYDQSSPSLWRWLGLSSLPADAASKRTESYRLWRRLLQNYSAREFTDSGDRVVAIQGVVRQMRIVLDGEECILGVWKGDVLRSLIWFVEPGDEKHLVVGGDGGKNASVSAPSWAWASVPDPVQYRLWHPFARYLDIGTEYIEPRATIVEISATQFDVTSFRHFTGSIVLKAPLASVTKDLLINVPGCRLILDPRPKGWYDYPTADGADKPRGFPDQPCCGGFYEHYWQQFLPKFVAVPVLEGGYSQERMAQYCLILDPVGEDTYRRLGVLVIATNLAKLCLNDPNVCQNEFCRLRASYVVGDVRVETGGSKCLGKMRYIHII